MLCDIIPKTMAPSTTKDYFRFPYLSAGEWEEVLSNLSAAEDAASMRIMRVIECLFERPGRKLNAKAIGRTIGVAYQRLNVDIGMFGRHLHNLYGRPSRIPPLGESGELRPWNIVFDGEDLISGGQTPFYWRIKPEMESAIESLQLFRRNRSPAKHDISTADEVKNAADTAEFEGWDRLAMLKARVNHGKFRSKVLKARKACQICGLKTKQLLIASHIKPWAKSDPSEKTDIDNALLLCPIHDALFDMGFISFADDGKILLSAELSEEELRLMNIDKNFMLKIPEGMRKYITYHRENIFRGQL